MAAAVGATRFVRRVVRPALCAAAIGALAACSGGPHARYGGNPANYTPPGPAEDPWGPYIREAATRFQVPETWVREVMRQELGGKQYLGGELTTSGAGAMGLMQVMPATYEELRQRHGLGEDAYDPHNNILAGTAYIREMYDRYGSPGFLAAYNAGPARVDSYLAGGSLPNETVNYVAAISPRLGSGDGGSRSAYASAAPAASPGRTTVVAAMTPIASPGDPGMPATTPAVSTMAPIASPGDPGMPAAVQVASTMAPIASPGDPGMPAAMPVASAAPPISGPTIQPAVERVAGSRSSGLLQTASSLVVPSASAAEVRPMAPLTAAAASHPGFRFVANSPPGFSAGGHPTGRYGIQVGAFASPGEARGAAENARHLAGSVPRDAETVLGTYARPDGTVLFRARLMGMPPDAASRACQRLQSNRVSCFIVSPEGTS